MFRRSSTSNAIQLALTALSTSLVCVATIIFSIYVPQTRGFFNFGETMVYAVALLFGPFIGSFAGGVGSMFADILLGYYQYAPATLVIKALEGGLVGFLGRKGILIGLLGFLYYSGIVELGSGIFSIGTQTIFIPPEFWFATGAFVTFLISTIAFFSEPEFGWMVISTVFGGLIMVTGYFLYEQLFLGVFALAEIPVNIGQMTVGLIAATPIVKVVRRSLPRFKD
jgi:uncharacterized membrane protein